MSLPLPGFVHFQYLKCTIRKLYIYACVHFAFVLDSTMQTSLPHVRLTGAIILKSLLNSGVESKFSTVFLLPVPGAGVMFRSVSSCQYFKARRERIIRSD